MIRVTGLEIQYKVRHWMASPVYGYLGSDYGNDLKAILQRPQNNSLADEQLAKLKKDIAATQIIPASDVNIYAVHTPPDKVELVIEIAGRGVVFRDEV